MPDRCAVATCQAVLPQGMTYRIKGHAVCATHFTEWEDARRPDDYLERKGTRAGKPNEYRIVITV